MLSPIVKAFFTISFLSLAFCQPIQYSQQEPSQAEEQVLDNSFDGRNSTQHFTSLRSSQREFEDSFLSDKLDLVFILDTSPEMEEFYKKNLLAPNFLSRLKDYDWKLAWTDMSVNVEKLLQQEKQEEARGPEREEESCGFLVGLGIAATGVITGQPALLGFGLENLTDCISFSDLDTETEQQQVFSNGTFLPFEHKGKKLKPKLTQSTQNYNAIFNHSLKLGNNNQRVSYDAPEQRQTESYPFLATALSMAKGKHSPNEKTTPFFREDSVITYVLITMQDMQTSISSEKFEQSIESFFGSKKRVKLIPVTLNENSSLFCSLNFQSKSTGARKLEKLASDLGSDTLDICSKNLSDELFNEISKSLYPKGFLSQ